MVALTCNPTTWEAGAVNGEPEVCLGYIFRLLLNKKGHDLRRKEPLRRYQYGEM